MIELTVNGAARQFDGDPAMPLLWYLRDLLELTGAKFGCGMGLCGSCTVHVEGKPMRSCVLTMSDAAGKRVTTIEGLSARGDHPIQKAWKSVNVPQCGYCQAGQMMQAAALLNDKDATAWSTCSNFWVTIARSTPGRPTPARAMTRSILSTLRACAA